MNIFKLAIKMLKNNFKIYKTTMLVLIMSSAIYYNFVSLKYNSIVVEVSDLLYVFLAINVCTMVFTFFVFYFLSHSNSFLLKQRTKEIGIYQLLGVSQSKVAGILCIEAVYMFIISIAIGILIGIATSKLFIMGYAKIINLGVVIPFEISNSAIKEVIIVLGTISVITTYKSYNKINKLTLINLINYFKKGESELKYKFLKGMLSLILILGGYFLIQGALENEDLIFIAMFVVAIEIVGTNLFFSSLFPVILKRITNNKKSLYEKQWLITTSNISFRIKTNNKTYAMIAITVATLISTLSVSLIFLYIVLTGNDIGFMSFTGSSYEVVGYISALFGYLGLILALIFTISLGITLFFRTISETIEDKKIYDILFKIGLSDEQLKKILKKQIGIPMLIPSFLGVIHATVAVYVLRDVLTMDIILPISIFISILIFLIFNFLFYCLILDKTYKQILAYK